MYKARYYVAVL